MGRRVCASLYDWVVPQIDFQDSANSQQFGNESFLVPFFVEAY